jgi:hypothetical protein
VADFCTPLHTLSSIALFPSGSDWMPVSTRTQGAKTLIPSHRPPHYAPRSQGRRPKVS